jgi:GT2 family glycosyltransferase
MALSAALTLTRHAFQLNRFGAPRLLTHYAALSYLNRTSRAFPIGRIPRRVEKPSAEADTAISVLPDADVVVPIYNNFDGTRNLLEVLRLEAPKLARVILVHDCSTDERIAPMLRAFSNSVPNAVLIENERNQGFVETCNRGIADSKNDVVILNTDIELPRSAIARLIRALRSAGDIATATPFSNSAYGVGTPELKYHNERPFGATTAEFDDAFKSLDGLSPIDIPRGVGFCMAMSRAVIERIGAFSSAFGEGYGEEADFCMRARRIGYRSVIAPNAYVYHAGGASFGDSWQTKARRGQLRFLERHPNYVQLVREYLALSEARAAGFAAMVGLVQKISGREIQIRPGREIPWHVRDTVPMLQFWQSKRRVVSRLILNDETYTFTFANSEIAREAFALAGLSPG